MEIRIGKLARKCAASERPFAHGETVTSVVRMEEQRLVRRDYAREAWEESIGQAAVAVWETVYRDPEIEEREPPEAYSPLRRLFYEALESQDRAELAKAYLAAQLLRRQRVFRLLKESAEEEEVRLVLFSDRLGDRLIEVRDPNLSYAELEEGRKRLVQRLEELESPKPAEEESYAQSSEEPAGQN